MRGRFARGLTSAGISVLLATCSVGSSSVPPGGSPTTVSSGSASVASPSFVPSASAAAPSPATALVGEWERDTRCEEIVQRLSDAGLDKSIPDVAAAFVVGASSGADLADPSKPCTGAVPIRHSHFFTADGRFGSRDQNGQDVDDGTYRLVGDDTFVISKEFPDVTFHYVASDDSIMFTPVIPACRPACFEATWSVTVAYEGLPWARVTP
jgi:hypothetical protein